MNRETTLEQYWEQRLQARDWIMSVSEKPREVLRAPYVLWRLSELLEKMQEATGARSVHQHALARMLKAAGFNKVGKGTGVRTVDGQARLWIMRLGVRISPTEAARLYDKEREQLI